MGKRPQKDENGWKEKKTQKNEREAREHRERRRCQQKMMSIINLYGLRRNTGNGSNAGKERSSFSASVVFCWVFKFLLAFLLVHRESVSESQSPWHRFSAIFLTKKSLNVIICLALNMDISLSITNLRNILFNHDISGELLCFMPDVSIVGGNPPSSYVRPTKTKTSLISVFLPSSLFASLRRGRHCKCQIVCKTARAGFQGGGSRCIHICLVLGCASYIRCWIWTTFGRAIHTTGRNGSLHCMSANRNIIHAPYFKCKTK